MTEQKIRFNTQACRRCSGTGKFSWNSADGDRCYGCGGKGKVRTAAAKRAAAALTGWLTENASVSVADVKAGDTIWWSAWPGKAGWAVVESVEEGTGSAAFTNGGVRYESEGAVVFRSGTRSVQHHLFGDRTDKVRRPLTADEYAQYIEFAATLSGVSVITKEEVPA